MLWNNRYSTDVIVYLVRSADSGAQLGIYCEEDLQVADGVHPIEQFLEHESYWFTRLGLIRGEVSPQGLTVYNSELAKLSVPPESSLHTGRQNPAFGKSEFERHVFRATFQAIEQMLDGWKLQEDDDSVNAYALKALKISPERLESVTRGVYALERVHEIVEISVIKHWYDPSWPARHIPCDDLTLAEFSFHIPLQFRRMDEPESISVKVMTMALC